MTPTLTTPLSRGLTLVKHQLESRYHARRRVSTASRARFERVVARHARGEDAVFLHVGLSDVAAAFDVDDPYEYLLDVVRDEFESVLAPGFTDYFTTSGVYHKRYSRPKHGTFGRLFLQDADYRTDDAIKSILVDGPYRFEGRVHEDSYHPNGCFEKLVADDVLVMDVGVPWFTCSHLHYFESVFDVPYMTEQSYEGVRYDDETSHESVTQSSGRYTSPYYSFNKPKIQQAMADAGALDSYDFGGMTVLVFSLGDLQEVLREKLSDDPYYLVTL